MSEHAESVPQCTVCSYWQARGGLIDERRYECTLVECADFGPIAPLLMAVARDYAAKGICPVAAPLDQHEDAFRSLDLIDQGSMKKHMKPE